MLDETLACAFVVALLGCDAVVSLDPVIGELDAIPAPEILGEWTSNDTVIYRVTPDSSNPAAYIARITGPAIVEEPDLANVRIALRATRIRERLFVEATSSEADSLLGHVMAAYGKILRGGYVHAVVVAGPDSLRVFPIQVTAVRDAVTSGACPSASGRVLLRPSGAIDRDVILGGSPSEMRTVVTCFLERPAVLSESEVLHRPRARPDPRGPRRGEGYLPAHGGSLTSRRSPSALTGW